MSIRLCWHTFECKTSSNHVHTSCHFEIILHISNHFRNNFLDQSLKFIFSLIQITCQRNSTPISEERRTEEVLPYTKLLHIKDAPPLPYPSQYITQLTGKDIDDSEYEVPVSHQDQHDGHSLYEDVDDPEEVYEDVQDTET